MECFAVKNMKYILGNNLDGNFTLLYSHALHVLFNFNKTILNSVIVYITAR